MVQRIVLIGGGGYLGAKIIQYLQSEDYEDVEIVVVDLQFLQFETIPIDINRVVIFKGSFLDEPLLDRVLPRSDTVFHIAAVGMMGFHEREKIMTINVEGTRTLIKKCQEHSIKHFVFASSIAVVFVGKPLYDNKESDPLPNEKNYLNNYSLSKSMSEKLVLDSSTEQFKTTALRFRAIYGPGDPNTTRRVVGMIKAGYFKFLFSKHEQEALSQSTSVENAAQAFLLARNELKRKNGIHGQVYNILDAEIVGTFTFWKDLINGLGYQMPTHYINYHLTLFFAKLNEAVSSFTGKDPILSVFDAEVLAHTNTYSIEKARNEIGYLAKPGIMGQVRKYEEMKRKKEVTDKSLSVIIWTLVIPSLWCAVACYVAFVSFFCSHV